MGNCVCIENGKIKSLEENVITEESYNISKNNLKSLINIKEKSNENSIGYYKQNFTRSIISNSSIDNSINDFPTLIQSNIKDIPQRNSLFGLSNDIIDKKNNTRKYFTIKIKNVNNEFDKRLDSSFNSFNSFKKPIFSKLCEHSKRNRKLSLVD